MEAVMAESRRGSDHLHSNELDAEMLSSLWDFIDASDDALLQGWWVRGQPAPDSITGTVTARPGSVADVVGGILEVGSPARVGVVVFPYGIPVIDNFLINFASGGS
jgi:hypothetical protein